jgi:hypothetical protein
MRRLVTSAICLSALLVAASVSDASTHHKPSPKCPPAHSDVVAADTQAQVYEIHGRLSSEAFGCSYRDKRSFELGEPAECGGSDECPGVGFETLTGPIVAYEESYGEKGGPVASNLVVVRDLRKGRVLHRVPTGTAQLPRPQVVGDGGVVAIVAKADGAVAWIVQTFYSSNSAPSEYEVHAVDKTGNRLLASGAQINSHSLALAGSTLYWTQGGKPMSATLD